MSRALATPPNVLFILADDLGIGDLRCYGNPHLDTPVLDELAESGVRFTHHYSPSPLCAPARAGFLTGRFNHRTGAVDVSSNRGLDRIHLSERTFGDYFRSAGYATALIGKWHNGVYCEDYLPHNRGFDLFFGFANGAHDYWKWRLMRNGETVTSDGRYLTDVFSDQAIQFIRHNRDRPFALFLAHHAPHPPLQAPQPLVEKYRRRLEGAHHGDVAVVYAMIEAMDAAVGRVLGALDRLNLREKTVIVFTSDNGAELRGSLNRFHGEFRGNKGEVLEQGIRVPAMVSWPGCLPACRVVSTPVHGCDWLPTLFGLTGFPPPRGAEPFDGRDLMPLLRDGETTEWTERQLPFQKNRYTPVAHSDASIRCERWKLYWPGVPETMKKDLARDNYSFERGVVEPHWEMPIDSELPSFDHTATEPPRLFDLSADPGESRDVSAQHPEVVARLQADYDSWFAEVFAEWERAHAAICRHDDDYWSHRLPPDPRALFDDYWP